jgi:ligand-binding sensor domain-containing protein
MCFLQAYTQQPKHYAFTHYGSSAGLASHEVLCVAQDDDRYIWIGTTNGLQRFDGVRFRTFRNQKNDPASIPGNVISQIMIDNKQNLWIQAAGGEKVGIFDRKTFTFREVPIRSSNEMWVKNAKGLVKDEYGNIFVVIGGLELLTYNEAKNEFSPAYNFIRFPKEWKIFSLLQQPGTKKYWLGTQNGIAVYNRETNKLSYGGNNVENDDIINKLGKIKGLVFSTIDSMGRFWFETWRDGAPIMWAYNLRSKKIDLQEYSLVKTIGTYHELGGMLVQRDGTVWLKGLGVFGRYLEKEKYFELVHNGFENEQSIAYNRVFDLCEDTEGNIWVATGNNGLYRFTPSDQFFANIRQTDRVTGKPGNGSMMSFVRTNKGTVLAGAWGDGVYHYDTNFNMIPLNIRGFSEKTTPSMWSMFASHDGNTIWMGAQPGIYRIDQEKRTATFYNPPILKERTIRQVAEDNHGNLWIGTQSLGLFKWTKEKGKIKFEAGISSFSAIPESQILKIYIDKKGLVWICTSNLGVYVIDPANDKIVLHLGMKEPVARRLLWDGVASVLDYDDSTMVIAANGLHLFNTKKQQITKSISLPESIPGTIAAMEKDNLGYLWVSMTSGIFRVNPRNEIFIHFDRIDGIANDYFVYGASYTLPDGKIIFGADNQLVYFDPLKVHINDPAPSVSITGFRLMNRPLPLDSLLKRKSIELDAGDNSISIEFSGLSFNSAYIIRYKLEGLDKEWQKADNTSQAVYSHLPPGTYTFLAKSEDAEGVPSKTITRLVIQVSPPFWKTWWFFCILALLLASVIYWLDKQRVNKLIEVQNVRSEIAGNLHQEVNTTLNNINLLSEMARIKADKDIDRSKEYIDQISTKSHNMIIAMDDILWSIDPNNDTMEKSLLRMMEFADSLKKEYGVSIELALDKKVRSLRPDMKIRHEVSIIFKDALRMIVQYSGGKETLIHIDLFKNKLSIKLQDATASLEKNVDEIDRIIREMNNRVGFIQADIDVQYDKKGVVVILLVPVK